MAGYWSCLLMPFLYVPVIKALAVCMAVNRNTSPVPHNRNSPLLDGPRGLWCTQPFCDHSCLKNMTIRDAGDPNLTEEIVRAPAVNHKSAFVTTVTTL